MYRCSFYVADKTKWKFFSCHAFDEVDPKTVELAVFIVLLPTTVCKYITIKICALVIQESNSPIRNFIVNEQELS